jgi:hypothetical protein
MTTMMTPIEVSCPSCESRFPVDPARVPEAGILAICSACRRAFPVSRPEGWSPDRDELAVEAAVEVDTAWTPAESGVEGVDVGDADARAEADLAATGVDDVEEVVDAGLEADEADLAPIEVEDAEEVVDAGLEADEADLAPIEVEDVEEGVDAGFETAEADLAPIEVDDVEVVVDAEEVPPGVGASEEESVELPGEEAGEEPVVELRGEPAFDVEEAEAPGTMVEEVVRPEADDPPPAHAGGASAPEGEPSTGVDPDAGTSPVSDGVSRFARRDPANRARRLARVLASDMITYNPARYADARKQGTLRVDFQDEIEKSWEEYVEQVGEELAYSTSHFVDALNDVLAQGEVLFKGPGRPW